MILGNFYLWHDSDWMLVILIVLAVFFLPVVWVLMEAIADEVNRRSSSGPPMETRQILSWLAIFRAHQKIIPRSSVRRILTCVITVIWILVVGIVLRLVLVGNPR